MAKTFQRMNVFRRLRQTLCAAKNAARDAWVRYVPVGGKPFELSGKYQFVDRRKRSNSLLLILAGYKKQLWPDVFARVVKFAPAELDVCVITSGLKSEELTDFCAKHCWSYLSTERNCLTLSQNIAIDLHPDAKWIYKIDEDVFLTEGFFEKLKNCEMSVRESGEVDIGFVVPLLNVNGYAYMKILEEFALVEDWTRKFGKPYYTIGLERHTEITKNADAAKFIWQIASIDAINERFRRSGRRYSITPYRYSIGAMLFSREVWELMGHYAVPTTGNGLGLDEEQICKFCMNQALAIVVCEETVAGHLAFGPQTKEMMKFHAENRQMFSIE